MTNTNGNDRSDYKSAWEHLKHYINEQVFCLPDERPVYQSILSKMQELEMALTADKKSEEDGSDKFSENLHIVSEKYGQFKTNNAANQIKRYFPKFDPKQLTAEDFKITADMFPAATLMDELLKETSLMHNRIIMDAFKELLGCKTAYDIYILYTTGYGVKQYNSVVDEVNKRLAAYGFSIGLGIAKEPLNPSTMIYEQIKANFEEVYANET